ncbi:MAG: hypothetical protein NTW69_14770 [Chloroflexi bacterium]|nr:hypothetical protein [Chloroflexota bacterium]
MKNRIFALLAILIVFSTTLVVQVSAKEEGSDVLKIGESTVIKNAPKPSIHAEYQTASAGQVNYSRNILGRAYLCMFFNKNALLSRVNSYLHFGKPQLLYHRRCSNWLSSVIVD